MAGTGVDGRVLLFTLVISLSTGILFGIIPASRVSQFHLTYSLKQGGGQSGVGSGGHRLRDALVVCEVALAIVLLSGAALLIRSLQNLYHLDPGFRSDHVLVMRTPLPRQKYEEFAPRTAFYDQVLARVEAIPGVVSAGYTTWVPLTNSGGATGITIEGKPEPAPGNILIPNTRIISLDYMKTLHMKLVEGRDIEPGDAAGKLPVALVNQTLARNYWPGENPIGKHFKVGGYSEKSPWITVIGIVGDVHQAGLDVPARAEMYLPYQQQDFGYEPEYLAVRTSGDPTAAAVQGADIITTVTADKCNATILTPQMIVPGVHLNAVGGDCPGKTELHREILLRADARVVVEFEPQSRIEGEIQQVDAAFAVTELAQVLAGARPARASEREVTIFDSVGFALEDFSALRYLLRIHHEERGGQAQIDLVPDLDDPKDLFALLAPQAAPIVARPGVLA
jgi:hypothetical protein